MVGAVVEADFLRDLRDLCVGTLTESGYVVPDGTNTHEACVLYQNVRRRLIQPGHRRVVRSRELVARDLPAAEREGVERLAGVAAEGGDLSPFLSRKLVKSRFNDWLLNDWGIHHLHLGTLDGGKNGFSVGTESLLFVVVRKDALYLLDVLDHKSFSDARLVEIVHTNWPDLIAQFRVPWAKGVETAVTDEERARLRAVGIQPPLQLADGTVYGPMGGGYATSGLSIQVLRQADNMIEETRRLQVAVESAADWYANVVLEQKGMTLPKLRFRLAGRNEKGFQILEEQSKCLFTVPVKEPPRRPPLQL